MAAVKLYLDSLHLISAGSTDITTVLECIDFAQFEGKTTYDSFEVDLVEELMDSIMNTSLPLCTELLISAYLHRVDNLDERYQLRTAEKLTQKAVNFEDNALNTRLIEMCISKAIFEDGPHCFSNPSVFSILEMYKHELMEFYASVASEDYRPDPRSLRYYTSFFTNHTSFQL